MVRRRRSFLSLDGMPPRFDGSSGFDPGRCVAASRAFVLSFRTPGWVRPCERSTRKEADARSYAGGLREEPIHPEQEVAVPIATREAEIIWEGPLASGTGRVSSGSGAFGELPVTWASRTERPDGKTSPEELIAAAHASCFAMAVSLVLGENHTPAERLVVSATCTL